MDSPKNPILAIKKPRSQRSRRHRGIQPRRARTRQLSSHAKNKILARQKGRLKFRRPLFLIRFLLKILQQPQPFRVRHIRKAALIRAGLPSLRGCQRRFRNIRDILLRQPMLLAQGFQIVGRVPKLRVFNHKIPYCRFLRARSHASPASLAIRGAFLICSNVRLLGWAISRPSNTPSETFENLKTQPSSCLAVCVSKSTVQRRCQFLFG